MNSLRQGWIFPIIILFVLISVIAVGIYQLNSEGNPWYFGESDISRFHWEFLSGE